MKYEWKVQNSRFELCSFFALWSSTLNFFCAGRVVGAGARNWRSWKRGRKTSKQKQNLFFNLFFSVTLFPHPLPLPPPQKKQRYYSNSNLKFAIIKSEIKRRGEKRKGGADKTIEKRAFFCFIFIFSFNYLKFCKIFFRTNYFYSLNQLACLLRILIDWANEEKKIPTRKHRSSVKEKKFRSKNFF